MSTTTISRRSEDTAARAAGALLGHAVGDALGLGTEFLSRERVAEWYPRGLLDYDAIVRDPHRRKWKPGESTDDTGQMLALADVLAEHGDGPTFEAAFARALDAWVRRDARGIGKLTVRVLCNRDYLADPLGTARAAAARLGDGAASNGSLMRVTPAGVAFWDDPKRAAAMGARSSLVSHSDPRCVDACRVVAACVAALVGGAAVDDAWACAAACAELPETRAWMERARRCAPDGLGLDEGTRPGEPNRIGFVFLALSAGLSALLRAQTFEEGLLWVVHAGGDADTNGAVAGGLLGARFGAAGVPGRWTEALVPADACRSAALRLT